jgi:hypothetical protein
MWGITILLMHLADYFHGRKDNKTCKICNYLAKDEAELDIHYRQKHPL